MAVGDGDGDLITGLYFVDTVVLSPDLLSSVIKISTPRSRGFNALSCFLQYLQEAWSER